nr:helix-hairpin-helix domain-containing protein [Thermococcus alcaliphilus]
MNHEINLAPEDVLLGVKGIGKVLAWRIIRNRPYGSIEELQKVRGIGKKRLKELREHFWCLEERNIENSEKEEGQSRNQHRSVNLS